MKKVSISALLLVACLAAPAPAQTRRSVQPVQLWPELQAELALKNGDYLLLAAHGEYVPAYHDATGPDRFLGLDQRALGAAYEHFWNDHWSAGGTLAVSAAGRSYLVPALLLRHRSALGPLTFGQRLGAAREYALGRYYGGPAPAAQNWLSLRADLEKVLPLGSRGLALRPRLSYEAAARVRLQKSLDDPDERTVQATSLRAEVGCRVGDHFDFTPWFAYTTAYYVVLEQYSPTGSPVSGGRLNLVTPVVGLDARFTLFAGKTTFERRQLPTQH